MRHHPDPVPAGFRKPAMRALMAATRRRAVLFFSVLIGPALVVSLSGQGFPFDQVRTSVDGVLTKVSVDSITIAAKTGKTTTCSLDARTPVVDTKGQMIWTQPHIVKFDGLLKTGDEVNVGCYSLGGWAHASTIKQIDAGGTTKAQFSVPQPLVPLPGPSTEPDKTLAIVPVFLRRIERE
jgi:hypothetical protein